MKLRNKKTGEIGYTAVLRSKAIVVMDENGIQLGSYTSLAELIEEWEDYEEPKEYWFISTTGEVHRFEGEDKTYTPGRKQLGNYFGTKEEAELAVRKLKAWKRLKDKGFHWLWYNSTPAGNSVDFYISDWDKEATRDITLLFGGEE